MVRTAHKDFHYFKEPYIMWHKFPFKKKKRGWDFPGGAVVKNPSANAGDTGLIPGPGKSHMPRSN